MSTLSTSEVQPQKLDHHAIEFYAAPHRVLRALRASEISSGEFLFTRGGTQIIAKRGSQLWTDDRAGVLGRGSISLVAHMLDCSETDAAEWLAKFARMRWRFLDSTEFVRRAA